MEGPWGLTMLNWDPANSENPGGYAWKHFPPNVGIDRQEEG